MSGHALRRLVKKGLSAMPALIRGPLSRVSLRVYEASLALRQSLSERRGGGEGPPLPPPRMRVMVVGHADPAPFLEQGRRHNQLVRGALARAGTDAGDLERLLEWGCGCGRVTRWWADLPAVEVHGCDYNPKLVRWVDRNLPFAQARVNPLDPPLPYGPAEFDCAYAISVFTHMGDRPAVAWMREIGRILRRGGLFFFTTHGLAYRDRLGPAERARFDSGAPVALFPEAEGSNLCASYYPAEWVRETLIEGFELVELQEAHRLPPERLDGLLQDRWLVRKTA